MRNKWVAWVAAAGVVVAGGVTLALTVFGDDGSSPVASGRSTTSTSRRTANVPVPGDVPRTGDATEVLALLDRAEQSTFHAAWKAKAAESGFSSITFEVWNKPPNARRDVRVLSGEGGGSFHSVTVRNGDGLTSCGRATDADAWECEAADPKDETADPLASILDSIRTTVQSGKVAAKPEGPKGRPGRCFTITAAEGEDVVCFTPEGVPISIGSGGATLELVDLSSEVPEAVLFPPAKPSAPSSTVGP